MPGFGEGVSASWRRLLLWSSLVALLASETAALGQTPLASASPAGTGLGRAGETPLISGGGVDSAIRTLESKLAEAREQLAIFNETGPTNLPPGILPQEGWTRRAGLDRLVRLYEQQLSNRAALAKVRARREELARDAQAWTRFAEPPPYSVLLTDRLQEEIQAERQTIRNSEEAAAVLSRLIEENRATLAKAEEKLRQQTERLEGQSSPAVVARLSWEREQERLRSQVAVASIAVLDSERRVGQETLAASQIRLGLLQRQLRLMEADTKFTQADLDQVMGQIDKERERLEGELARAEPRRLNALKALETARQDGRREPNRPADTSAAIRAAELVSGREAQADLADSTVYVLRLLLESLNVERVMWELRFAAYARPSLEILRASEPRLVTFTRRLDLWGHYARQQLEAASSQLQLQEMRLNTMAPDSDLLLLARERFDALHQQEQLLFRLVRGIQRVGRLGDRWAEGLHDTQAKLPFSSRVGYVFSETRSFVRRLWTFEVFAAEDTITVDGRPITGRRSVTVGKIVLALLILVGGYWMTGWVAAWIEPVFVKRLKIDPNQANLIRRWFRAFLVLLLLLVSLVSVKIPLTVFAFAGGALAIGLGFGMQTVLKNFVSGLILLFERPFRVGDVLDVSGQKGTVTSIGLRASVLQLWDGTETLIPNSSLLENNLTNWTYSSSKVRFVVTVGVAYGSDLRQVLQLLAEATERHGLVEKEPKPLVLFTDFGENALTFEIRFWVDVTQANAAQVASDLRQIIAGAFAEHGIVIAFPQRDLHLHAPQPLPMQLVSAPADGPGERWTLVKIASREACCDTP